VSRAGVATLATVAAVGACGGGDEGSGGGPVAETVEVELKEQNSSGITGLATLAERGDATNVVVEMIQPFDIDPQPLHIHRGTCADLDPEPAFALPNLEDGIGGGDVAISLDELREGDYAINVHKSVREADVYVACGEIKEAGR
jgi:hypothetical protein